MTAASQNTTNNDRPVGKKNLNSFNLNKFDKNLKTLRIKNLRSLRSKKTLVPNLKAKLWALRLMDEVYGKRAINLPGEETSSTSSDEDALGCTRETLRPERQQMSLGGTRDTLSSKSSSQADSIEALGCTRDTLREDGSQQ